MRTILSVIGAIILFVFVAILIYLGEVNLFDFITQLAVGLAIVAVGLLAWGFKPYFDKDVNLKIKNSRIEIHNIGTKREQKRIFFDVENNGKVGAKGCRVKVKVVNEWDESETLLPSFPSIVENFNILAKDRQPIYLCEVEKNRPTTTVIHIANIGVRSALTKGIYDLELCITGENFANGKTHKLRLDISSWENFGIILDC